MDNDAREITELLDGLRSASARNHVWGPLSRVILHLAGYVFDCQKKITQLMELASGITRIIKGQKEALERISSRLDRLERANPGAQGEP